MENKQLPQHVRNVIEHLEKLWQLPQELSPDDFRKITEFVMGLQEPYKTIGLRKIAEHTVSNMNLHILSLMALFQQKAEEENVELEDQIETFRHINPTTFPLMEKLSESISISSLEDLAALSSVTIGLQTLSQSDSAQEAQSWLYELPTMYYQQLEQEKLLTPEKLHIRISNWISYDEVFQSTPATGYATILPNLPLTPTPTKMVLLAPDQNTSTWAA